MIYDSLASLVGRTPILRLKNIEEYFGLDSEICAKLEYFNPAGSVKDRVAKEMIEQYEREGKISSDTTIIEPTSGNTGIGIAAICASKGLRAIIVMPDSMSRERIMLMKAYGAEVVLTDGALGMKGAIDKADELAKSIKGSMIAGQFENPSNPRAHYKTTGPEIYEDCDGRVDIFVATAGTGGTVSGTAKYLKEMDKNIKVIAVEPASSPFLTEGHAGAHKIQGIGAGFLPRNLDLSLIDRVVAVTDEAAYDMTRLVAQREGLLVGISSGAALEAAVKLARDEENRQKRIVVLLPDTGERYLSSGVFEE